MTSTAVPVLVCEADLVLLNQTGELARLKQWLEEVGDRFEIPADRLFEIKTAVYEAVANVICHGFDDSAEHRIGVHLRVSGRAVEITVDDDGRPFNPLSALPRRQATSVGEAEIGGRGILLMRSFSDRMRYERVGERNYLTLIRLLPAER